MIENNLLSLNFGSGSTEIHSCLTAAISYRNIFTGHCLTYSCIPSDNEIPDFYYQSKGCGGRDTFIIIIIQLLILLLITWFLIKVIKWFIKKKDS